MIITNCNNFIQGAYTVRKIYINICRTQLYKLQATHNVGLMQLTKLYDISDIVSAFYSIVINSNGYIEVPEHTKAAKILRYLEYGGENVKPTHLLTDSNKILFKTFAMKEE